MASSSDGELAINLAERRVRSMVVAPRTIAIVLVILLSGCGGGSDYPHAAISGSVSVDGKPVDDGTISYFSDHAGGQRFGKSTIREGAYKLTDVPLGEVVFTFSAAAETGRTIAGPDGAPEAERINLIPKQYSSEGIARQISNDGTQDFQLSNRR